MTDNHWAITLYERYVQLYGEPIEQPITPANHECSQPPNASPMNENGQRAAKSREGEQPPIAPNTLPPASRC